MAFKFDINNIKWQKGIYGLPEAVLKIKVPSVTGIINDMIPDPSWDAFVASIGQEEADKILMKAGQRGTATHTFVENFIGCYSKTKDVSEALKYTQIESPKALRKENIPDDKIEDGRNFFYKFYYSEHSNRYSNLLALELGIYSPTLFYRGKLDILYNDPLYGISLTDIKSSNGRIAKNSAKEIKYFYQLGAYAQALEEMYKEKNLKINYASVLCIDKQLDVLQEIELSGTNLTEYKEKFKTLVNEYHIKYNQEYLIK